MSEKILESTLKNMLLYLIIITSLAGVCLGMVYSITKPKIDQTNKEKELAAIASVLPENFSNKPDADVTSINTPDGKDALQCYPARDAQGKLMGMAVKTYSSKAYNGKIWLMAGFSPDGAIYKISILEQSETPGLGTKITDPQFNKQYEGKNPLNVSLKVKKDGGSIDAITGATISSRAFSDAIQKAHQAFMIYKQQKGDM